METRRLSLHQYTVDLHYCYRIASRTAINKQHKEDALFTVHWTALSPAAIHCTTSHTRAAESSTRSRHCTGLFSPASQFQQRKRSLSTRDCLIRLIAVASSVPQHQLNNPTTVCQKDAGQMAQQGGRRARYPHTGRAAEDQEAL